ncbi:hypothetical protein A2Y85_00260 [candidate division WOR-3 bacterium RBG_13_43_14]|uniref:Glycosyltransferase 2-like domain-containing protein n=1 Tax=candidate division WOR-3 bacterium RBG_13_43_14 TaxID=1802590 RepID=A0A1F4U2M1_UNCW3|nr:MAG: hypothetical protein A2Y85_00260 [candidate division WOR-3 bacterium RBG_13_43_14]
MINLVLLIYFLLLTVLFFYSFHSYLLLYYYFKFRQRLKDKKDKSSDTRPLVTVQLPIYNEKFVIRRLLRSVVDLDYPKSKLEIQVIDDSDDETTMIVNELVQYYRKNHFEIKHIRRGSRKGYKAGALQYATNLAKGDYLAIFDADFIVPRNFLKALIGEFSDPRVGSVQARWGHLNDRYSVLTRSQAISLDNHFVMEQGLRSEANFFINFNGTCGLWAKKAIIDAGGWQSDTLAEDLDLSYRVQLKGWSIKFRGDVIVEGELPDNANSYRIQQNRWAKGTIQVARKLLKTALRSDISWSAKYEAIVHLTCHINFIAMLGLAILTLPVVYFKVESYVSVTYYNIISFFTIGVFGYPFLYYLSQRKSYVSYWRRVPYIMGVIAYSMGLSLSNTKALIEGWFNQRMVFTRTPKSGGSRKKYYVDSNSIIPILETVLGLYNLASLVYVIIHMQIVLIPFLSLYSIGFLSMGLSSLRQGMTGLKPQEVLCSRENS